jgi:hypothetical protein
MKKIIFVCLFIPTLLACKVKKLSTPLKPKVEKDSTRPYQRFFENEPNTDIAKYEKSVSSL